MCLHKQWLLIILDQFKPKYPIPRFAALCPALAVPAAVCPCPVPFGTVGNMGLPRPVYNGFVGPLFGLGKVRPAVRMESTPPRVAIPPIQKSHNILRHSRLAFVKLPKYSIRLNRALNSRWSLTNTRNWVQLCLSSGNPLSCNVAKQFNVFNGILHPQWL